MNYYDTILVTIPTIMFSGIASGVIIQSIPLQIAIGSSALISSILIGDALFISYPEDNIKDGERVVSKK